MQSDFQEKIYSVYPTLTRGERLVADYFAEHYRDIPRMSLKELCRAIGVSEPTVFRFCTAMNFTGIKDIKLYIASHCLMVQKEEAAEHTAASEEGETRDFVKRILSAEQKILMTTFLHLDTQKVDEAARMMIGAQRIFLYGLGSSALVCQDAARKLTRMQMNAWALRDEEDLKSNLRFSQVPTVLFCVSHSGASQQVINVMRVAHELHIPVLLMTSYPQSAAAKYADLILQTFAIEELSSRVGMTSRISQFAVLDALALTVAHATEREFFLNIDKNSRKVLQIATGKDTAD